MTDIGLFYYVGLQLDIDLQKINSFHYLILRSCICLVYV